MTGGGGADVFVLSNFIPGDLDIINDFESGEDILAIDAIEVGLFDPSNPTGSWLLETGFQQKHFLVSDDTSLKTEDTYVRFDPSSKKLYVDVDANGNQEETLLVACKISKQNYCIATY